jgi:hypothetical protein
MRRFARAFRFLYDSAGIQPIADAATDLLTERPGGNSKMKTTNKNSLAVAAMGAVFPVCLALTCLSEPAAASVIYGTANGAVTCNANNTCSSVTPLPVGPGPGGGAKINPNDYGMCGLLHLAGTFDNSTAARIIVSADGYYAVERTWTGSPTGGPAVDWTCVYFTDFTGLPPISDGSTFPAPVETASGGSTVTDAIGGGGDACVWAGLTGGLASADQASHVFAQYNTSNTLDSAQSAGKNKLSTYAFCSAFKGYSFHNYYYGIASAGNGSTGGEPVALIFSPHSAAGLTAGWCYMEGVGNSAGGAFSAAGLSVLSTGQYAFDVGQGSQLWYNCLWPVH